MSDKTQIARLARVSQAILDQRLDALRRISADLDRSRAQRRALDASADPADLPPIAAQQVALTYERWADQRRAELNLVIARQTATLIEARQVAGTALGRVQVLDILIQKSKARPAD